MQPAKERRTETKKKEPENVSSPLTTQKSTERRTTFQKLPHFDPAVLHTSGTMADPSSSSSSSSRGVIRCGGAVRTQ